MKKAILATLLAALMLSAGAQNVQDHPALFQGVAPQKSSHEFRTWFREAYLREFRHYKKAHKGDYKYRKSDFRDCKIDFFVDTTGRPQILSVTPEDLHPVQMQVLHTTFDASPDWVPAFQNGRKVRMKYRLPVRE